MPLAAGVPLRSRWDCRWEVAVGRASGVERIERFFNIPSNTRVRTAASFHFRMSLTSQRLVVALGSATAWVFQGAAGWSMAFGTVTLY